MKLDIYHLYRGFTFNNFVSPIVPYVLKRWAEELGWKVRVHVCHERDADLSTDADVIAFSVFTQTAPAAYRIADVLRGKGKIILMGGPHLRGPETLAEAGFHSDVVSSSVSQQQWQQLLNDIAAGAIGPSQSPTKVIHDEQCLFRYPGDLHEHHDRLRWYQIPSVPTSLGCPYQCTFCSPYMPGAYLLRDVETIYNELSRAKRSLIWISDATFGLKKDFTIELMKRIAPLGKRLIVQTSIARLDDTEFLDALALGGTKIIGTGIESVTTGMNKHGGKDLKSTLIKISDEIHARGMALHGNIICGLDGDGPDSFEKTYEYLRSAHLDLVMTGVLTPYPNTAQHDQFMREKRIFDFNWEHYDYQHVVYQPKDMTVQQLLDGYAWLTRALSKELTIRGAVKGTFNKVGVSFELLSYMVYYFYNKIEGFHFSRQLKKTSRDLRELMGDSLDSDASGSGGQWQQ